MQTPGEIEIRLPTETRGVGGNLGGTEIFVVAVQIEAVVIFCATLGNAKTIALTKHPAPPLLTGFAVTWLVFIARD